MYAWAEKRKEHLKIKDYSKAIFCFNHFLKYGFDEQILEYRKNALNKLTQYFVQRILKQWQEKDKYSEFWEPDGICIDSMDNLYVTNKKRNEILKFNEHGSFLTRWGSDQLNGPTGITVDSDSNVYVIDSGNNRILKYSNFYA